MKRGSDFHDLELAPQDAPRVANRPLFGQDLSDEEVQKRFIQRLTDDFEFYCMTAVTIVNNNPHHPTARMGEIIPFRWNDPQRRLASLVMQCVAQGKPWLSLYRKQGSGAAQGSSHRSWTGP